MEGLFFLLKTFNSQGEKYLLIYSQGDSPKIVYADSFDYEKVQMLESTTGKKEAEIRQYIGKCDLSLKEFVEKLCSREKSNLLIQISFYVSMAVAGFVGMFHIAKGKAGALRPDR